MGTQRLPKIGWVAAIGFCLSIANAAELEGVVSEVGDGDSLTLATPSASYKVRLVDIDAPELSQPFGKDARTSLRTLCLLKGAKMNSRGADRYGRTLARVTCAGVDANAEQVRRGMAWVFERYAPKRSPLHGLQDDARAQLRGLWRDEAPVPPWEWRRVNRVDEVP